MVCTSLLVLSLLTPVTPGTPDIRAVKPAAKADFIPDKMVGDITGYYICEGSEGPGKKYKGIAVITKKEDVYLIQWIIGPGASFYGVGIRQDNTLAASWALPTEKGTVVRGVNLYQIEPGPRLAGRWAALPSDGTLRSETLTFLKKLEDD
jgi:hypothetical protein